MTARERHLPRALPLARQLLTYPRSLVSLPQESLWFLLCSLHSIFVTNLF